MQLDLFTHATPSTHVRAEVPDAPAYLPVYRVQLVQDMAIPTHRPPNRLFARRTFRSSEPSRRRCPLD
jgi:hypothetical protein